MLHEIDDASKIPTVEVLKRQGRFLGYNQYCPVFTFKKRNWEVVDIYRDGKCYEYVERYRLRIGKLVNGYHSYTGDPI